MIDVNYEHYCVTYKIEALISDNSLATSMNSKKFGITSTFITEDNSLKASGVMTTDHYNEN